MDQHRGDSCFLQRFIFLQGRSARFLFQSISSLIFPGNTSEKDKNQTSSTELSDGRACHLSISFGEASCLLSRKTMLGLFSRNRDQDKYSVCAEGGQLTSELIRRGAGAR